MSLTKWVLAEKMNGNRKTEIRHSSFWGRVGLWRHPGLEVPDDTFEDAFVYKSMAPNKGVMHPGPMGANSGPRATFSFFTTLKKNHPEE